MKSLRRLFWAFFELATGSSFDRATFQTYLKMLDACISPSTNLPTSAIKSLTTSLSKEIATFGSEVHLTTGLGMERIWRYFKPDTPKSQKQLSAIVALENLADRLDSVMWKSKLKVDEMVQIRERFSSSLELARKQDVEAGELITVSFVFVCYSL